MNINSKKQISFIIWIVIIIAIGSIIGSLTKPEINVWYNKLNRSPLTPPNYVFPVAWTLLYASIGACGSIIWRSEVFTELNTIKILYVIQLILNWSWTPLFFYFHLTGPSLVVLIGMDIMVFYIILLSSSKLKSVSFLMMPYLFWILFASYLNFYIWRYSNYTMSNVL